MGLLVVSPRALLFCALVAASLLVAQAGATLRGAHGEARRQLGQDEEVRVMPDLARLCLTSPEWMSARPPRSLAPHPQPTRSACSLACSPRSLVSPNPTPHRPQSLPVAVAAGPPIGRPGRRLPPAAAAPAPGAAAPGAAAAPPTGSANTTKVVPTVPNNRNSTSTYIWYARVCAQWVSRTALIDPQPPPFPTRLPATTAAAQRRQCRLAPPRGLEPAHQPGPARGYAVRGDHAQGNHGRGWVLPPRLPCVRRPHDGGRVDAPVEPAAGGAFSVWL